MCGLRCEGIQKRLLTESNLTLQRAIELSVSMELAAKEAQQLSSNSKVYKMETEKQMENKDPCFRCGKTGIHLSHVGIRIRSAAAVKKEGTSSVHVEIRKKKEKCSSRKPHLEGNKRNMYSPLTKKTRGSQTHRMMNFLCMCLLSQGELRHIESPRCWKDSQ